jgi:hypothetical protein
MSTRITGFNLLQVIFVGFICIMQGHAATPSELSDKTYTLVFSGVDAKFRFYIDKAGIIFQYAYPCPSVGSFTRLNGSNRGQFSCYRGPQLGTVTDSYTATASLSGSTITYDRVSDLRSSTGAAMNTPENMRWVFSTDGVRCNASPLSYYSQSYPAISCEVSAGRRAR